MISRLAFRHEDRTVLWILYILSVVVAVTICSFSPKDIGYNVAVMSVGWIGGIIFCALFIKKETSC